MINAIKNTLPNLQYIKQQFLSFEDFTYELAKLQITMSKLTYKNTIFNNYFLEKCWLISTFFFGNLE